MAGVILLALVLSGLGGCATTPATFTLQPGIDKDKPIERVWPGLPDAARYRFVGALFGEQNFEKNIAAGERVKRFFAWLVGLIVGDELPLQLQRPHSGLVASDGRILVTDVSRAAVYVFDSDQGVVALWEMAGENLRFEVPIAIVEVADGGFLVTDAELGFVVRLDAQGEPVGIIDHPTLKRPTGLARDPQTGLIYVSDSANHDIKVFDSHGELKRQIGRHGAGVGEFNGPTHLSFNDGLLYVSDTLNARIQVLTPEGDYQRSIGRRGLYLGDTPRPKGVAVDSKGNIYVVESYYDYLLVFNAVGDFLLPVGGTGNGIGQFFLPADVWIDQQDRIYVADSFNSRVMIFEYLDGSDSLSGQSIAK